MSFGGFLSGGRVLIYNEAHPRQVTHLRIVGPDCSVVASWDIDHAVIVLGISPEKDWIAIESWLNPPALGIPPKSKYELVDSRNHNVVQQWTWDTMSGAFHFVNHGNLVCTEFSHPACFDVETGAKTVENDKVIFKDETSVGGDLLAGHCVTHSGGIWTFLDMGGTWCEPRRQLIWNFHTGREIATWPLLFQKAFWSSDRKTERAITIIATSVRFRQPENISRTAVRDLSPCIR